MAFTWPPRTQYKVKELISQVLWVLKEEGDIEVAGSQCAVRILKDRLAAHGVEVAHDHGFRQMLAAMEGGRYGDLIVRKINGKRTHGIALYAQELPPNYLPDVEMELDMDVDEPAFETFGRQTLFSVAESEPEPQAAAPEPELEPEPVVEPAPLPAVAVRPVMPAPTPVPARAPAALTASVADVDREFDLIAAGLEADLEELRRPLATIVRPTTMERVGANRNLDDKAGVINAILSLVGDLAVMVAGEPTAQEGDVKTKERLADALESANRFRQRALDASETAAAKEAEIRGLRRQVSERDGKIARLEANVEALMTGEKAADDRLVNAAKRFISEKPNDRRGESKLVYSTGG